MMKKLNSLTVKIIVSIILLTLVISTVLIYVSYSTYKRTMDDHYEILGNQVADTTMAMIDDDIVKEFCNDPRLAQIKALIEYQDICDADEEDPEYEEKHAEYLSKKPKQDELYSIVYEVMAEPKYAALISTFRKIRSSNDVMYLYMVTFDDVGAYYIFDADETDEVCTYGYHIPYVADGEEGAFAPYVDTLLAGDDMPAMITDENYGYLISVFRPYKTDTGELLGYIAVDISMDAVAQDRQLYLRNCVIIMSIVTIIFAAIYVILFNILYVKPIKRMARATSEFVSTRDDDKLVDSPISALRVKTGDELQLLCNSLKKMEVDLNEHIENLRTVTSEKERIGAELDVATKIQASMLPCIFPAFPDRTDFDIHASMNPAKEVGGDFYDFFMVDEDNLAIVVADVSGKGVPAALFMVIGKTLIKDHTTSGRDLGEVFTEVNQLLCEANSEELFITAFVGVLNLKTGLFRYVNAGHEIPFIAKKGNAFKPYKIRAAFVLAGMEGLKYKAGEVQLEPGDKLFQYTDGVTEATDKDNNLYGMERLEKILGTLKDKTPQEILKGVKEDIDKFVGAAPQFDDITMLCLEYKEQEN